ncbi:hypothetical protein A8990_11990 [Paenibacillus taihuensis]|uniref:Uncharacterized protein n=1 Tax=Paenibacillus taihuensis TaxID=1156355 RepID=A0A3D9RX42_9BACL|nr:hypothetical protein [Paenibacillus taihuensis]REE81255.1 hypothetical protein A8990_11990 [Paenibacillus taihuensis]
MVNYRDFFAIEIYNHVTEWSTASSYGGAYWDHALQNGKRVWGIAADDSHGHYPNWRIPEYGGGWVQVQAGELTHESVIRSLKSGSFYSSSGPEVYDLRVEDDGYLKIECSPVKFIRFITHPFNGRNAFNRDASPVTSAAFRIDGEESYIRVECVDFEGNVAWSNPVFPGEWKGSSQQ